jgi:hypothetical protein
MTVSRTSVTLRIISFLYTKGDSYMFVPNYSNEPKVAKSDGDRNFLVHFIKSAR